MNPYLARTLLWIASKSAPEVLSCTVPSTAAVPSLTRPRASDGWIVIFGLFRRRLYFPDRDEVQKPTRPPSSGTIQVGVATGVPDFRYVVEEMYFSSLMPMS